MTEALTGSLLEVLSWPTFGLLLLGTTLGFIVGILPGLGGSVTLALMLPFVFHMTPTSAFAFLLSMHSVTAMTGEITSILFGIPGEASSAAIVLDGNALAKKGEAGRALGAALSSSLLGAVIGALALIVAVPILAPLSLSMGSPEFLMLGLLGISFVAALSGGSVLKGLIMGALGLLLATIGTDPWTNTYRYTGGQMYLWEGLPLIPFVVGFFGIPEVVELAMRGTSIAGSAARIGGVIEGVKDSLRHWMLTAFASVLGVIIGIIPGLGGSVANWMAYAYAVQSARDPTRFGKGAIEGVIAPGAASNAKEGGSLIPTLAFGVPGSSSMAILLGAFLILGINPGPDMLSKHLDVTFSMVWTIIIAHIVAIAASLLLINQLARLTRVRSSLVIPAILLMVYLGSITANNSIEDLVVTLVFGFLGCVMVALNWPRPPLVLGLVLGGIIERNLFISTARYGTGWLLHPGVIAIMLIIVLGLLVTSLKRGGLRPSSWLRRQDG